MARQPNKIIKGIIAVILVLVLVVAGYVAYVFIDFHRIGDISLNIDGNGESQAEAGKSYKIVSYNIGFGAYEADYGFFMDGGTESWAWSEERLLTNIENITDEIISLDADFYNLQEVDIDSTRSYHVNELNMIVEKLKDSFSYTWAQNYDSPFLFYPLTQPHGASKSGLLTLSSFTINSSNRVELPIEDTLKKLIDLDRCYSVNRISVDNGKELVLYNMHLSAYSSDGSIAIEQLSKLILDMQSEYEKGNYVVCCGDFNKDLLGNSSEYFGASEIEYTWAQAIPDGIFDNTNLTIYPPVDENNPVPTCRNADGPYNEGQYVVTIDGFIVSDNVTVESADVIDTQFAYSDHNPVSMTFILN